MDRKPLASEDGHFSTSVNVNIRDLYKEQWKQVQVLSDFFWKQWNDQYLHTLQSRRKWTTETPNLKAGDVVIVRDKDIARCQWPVGLVEEVIPSADELVRKVRVRLIVNGKPCTFMRPISELIRTIERNADRDVKVNYGAISYEVQTSDFLYIAVKSIGQL